MTDHRDPPDAATLAARILAASTSTDLPEHLSSQRLRLIILYYQNLLKDRPETQPEERTTRKKKKARKDRKETRTHPWAGSIDFDLYRFNFSCRYSLNQDQIFTFRLLDLRNRLAHGSDIDRWALMQDQQEIGEDFRIALLTLLARERPDLLLHFTDQLLHSSSGTELERNRARLLVIAALREAIKNRSSDFPDDKKTRELLGSASESKDNDL